MLGIGSVVVGLVMVVGGLWLLVADSSDGDEDAVAAAAGATEVASPSPEVTAEVPTATASPTPAMTATSTATAVPLTETPTPEPTAVTFSEAEVEAFVTGLRDAGNANDVDQLMAWLHPAVLERYGEETCREYLATTELALDVTVREVFPPAPWDWVTDDGEAGRFEDALEIEISRFVGGQTLLQLLHLVPDAGDLRWLTDCGEPVAS